MIRRKLYGWFDGKQVKLSAIPPDCPIRPCLAFDSMQDVKEFIRRRRADVYWWPPLPYSLRELE